jgi:hypothetical protein
MPTSFILASLATFAVSLMTGILSPSYAANCEAALKPLYTCTVTFDDGGLLNYCVTVDFAPRTDGEFRMVYNNDPAWCTCKATGTPPNVNFGVARDFFCTEDATQTTSIGTANQPCIQ